MRIVHLDKLLVLIVVVCSFPLLAQNNSVVSGIVKNRENGEPLPYASVSLKNHPIGTISNENGEFDFYVPLSKQGDTLSISFIGFNHYLIPLKNIDGKLEIKMQPALNVLDEVIVSRLSPLEYVQRAVENIDDNNPKNPYQSLAYYREKFIENDQVIKKDEGVFKTYYPIPGDSSKNEHQLILHRPEPNPQKFQFMREWFDKKQAKEKKKALKKGEDFEEFDFEKDMNLGGPETIINLSDISNDETDNFLNPEHFKKYEYSFGDETSLNGETLVTIEYKAKRKIDHVKDQGKILISKETFAIALIEGTGVLSIPAAIRPILFIIGLKISNPVFSKTIRFQKIKEAWYPSLFRWDANVNLTKRHAFSKNEYSKINIGQVFSINELDSIATPIPKSKQFNSSDEMKNQVYNDFNLDWNELNIVKE